MFNLHARAFALAGAVLGGLMPCQDANAVATYNAWVDGDLTIGLLGNTQTYTAYVGSSLTTYSASSNPQLSGSFPQSGTWTIGSSSNLANGSATMGGTYDPNALENDPDPPFYLSSFASATGTADGTASPGDVLSSSTISTANARFVVTIGNDGVKLVVSPEFDWGIALSKSVADSSEYAMAVVSISYDILDTQIYLIDGGTALSKQLFAQDGTTAQSDGATNVIGDVWSSIALDAGIYYLDVHLTAQGIAQSKVAQGSAPEPATLALFGLGLAGLGAMRRKKLVA